jgi:excisionase family DNA binding protein
LENFIDPRIGKGWLKVKKVAEFLDCSKAQVYDLVHGGELTAFKHGQALRISIESLEAFIERSVCNPFPPPPP